MAAEIPVLRLGLAGFDEVQQKMVAAAAAEAATARATWEIAPLAEADVWCLEGSRTRMQGDGLLRVQPGRAGEAPLQLALADVGRPIAVSRPFAVSQFQPAFTFELRPDSTAALIRRLGTWLQPIVAQFCLAADMLRHRPSLNSGSWEVLSGPELLAVVDLKLGTAVAPHAGPADFEDAIWCIRDHGDVEIPPEFVCASLSQLLWRYALRTRRDLLPPHYRTRRLYFRRPPRIAPRQLGDGHLLLLRELAAAPGLRFSQLQRATGWPEAELAHQLAALHLVGSITANPHRVPGLDSWRSRQNPGSVPSGLDFRGASEVVSVRPDLTAPVPLMPE